VLNRDLFFNSEQSGKQRFRHNTLQMVDVWHQEMEPVRNKGFLTTKRATATKANNDPRLVLHRARLVKHREHGAIK
jgi:hypothetical protein